MTILSFRFSNFKTATEPAAEDPQSAPDSDLFASQRPSNTARDVNEPFEPAALVQLR